MSTPRSLFRAVLIVTLAASAAGCIVIPRDPWGGHGRRGGHHLDQTPTYQTPMNEPYRPRPDGGRR